MLRAHNNRPKNCEITSVGFVPVSRTRSIETENTCSEELCHMQNHNALLLVAIVLVAPCLSQFSDWCVPDQMTATFEGKYDLG